MHAQLTLLEISNTASLLLVAAGLILGLLALKFLLRLAWRIFTIGCLVIALLAVAGSLALYFLK